MIALVSMEFAHARARPGPDSHIPTTIPKTVKHPIPSGGIAAWITAGPDGALWFTEDADSIGRATTTGVITEYPVLAAHSTPEWITTGPDGALWFTESGTNKIGRITTAGLLSEYLVPTANASPWGIASGPDGALWFTERNTNKIGRITTAGGITEYPVPAVGVNAPQPEAITTGPDGQLWFTLPPPGVTGAREPDNRIGEALFVTANLSVTPMSGVYQTSLTFTGSSFAANEHVNIYGSGVGSSILAKAVADSSGAITTTAHAPLSPFGPRLFLGVGQSSGKLGAASFFPVAKLLLNPMSGPVGSTITVSLDGFGPLESVKIRFRNPYVALLLAEAGTNIAGSATLTVTIPNTPSGPSTVLANGLATGARASSTFTVQ